VQIRRGFLLGWNWSGSFVAGFINRHSEMQWQEKPAPTAGFLTEAENPGAY
jgi:hypothetical protein